MILNRLFQKTVTTKIIISQSQIECIQKSWSPLKARYLYLQKSWAVLSSTVVYFFITHHKPNQFLWCWVYIFWNSRHAKVYPWTRFQICKVVLGHEFQNPVCFQTLTWKEIKKLSSNWPKYTLGKVTILKIIYEFSYFRGLQRTNACELASEIF